MLYLGHSFARVWVQAFAALVQQISVPPSPSATKAGRTQFPEQVSLLSFGLSISLYAALNPKPQKVLPTVYV